MSRFGALPDKLAFSDEEAKTLEFWNSIDAFQTSLKLSEGRPEYTFYDGPPFATGLPHYGYAVTKEPPLPRFLSLSLSLAWKLTTEQ